MMVLDLFSGIGSFSLGLERAGFRTCAFVEIDPYCRRVLAKHWPEVPQYHDVRELTAERLRADGISVDVICGGFPCTDISIAGKGAGITGPQSGLWSEFARLIGELRPRYALIENVAALVGRGLEQVLCDLAALRFDAEWRIISAADIGAPHRRERIWIVAYPSGEGRREVVRGAHGDEGADGPQHMLFAGGDGAQRDVAYPAGARRGTGQCEPGGALRDGARGAQPERLGGDVADADHQRQPQPQRRISDIGRWVGDGGGRQFVASVRGVAHGIFEGLDPGAIADPWADGEWPGVPRVAKGVRDRVSRLRSLGNSLVPQIPQMLGRAILAREAAA